MTLRLYGTLLLTVALCSPLAARQFISISATGCKWSGGIAGMHGDIYTFVFSLPRSCAPDSVWISGEKNAIAVVVADIRSPQPGANARATSVKGRTRYELNIKVSHDSYGMEAPTNGGRRFNGVALISYKCDGKTSYGLIKKLTKTLPPLSYP